MSDSKLYQLMLSTAAKWNADCENSNGKNNEAAATRFAVEEELNRRLREKGGVVRLEFLRTNHVARIHGLDVKFSIGEASPTDTKTVVTITSQVKHDGGWMSFMEWKQRFGSADLQRILRTPLNAEVDKALRRRINEIMRNGLNDRELLKMKNAVADFKFDKAKLKNKEKEQEPKGKKARPKDERIPTGRRPDLAPTPDSLRTPYVPRGPETNPHKRKEPHLATSEQPKREGGFQRRRLGDSGSSLRSVSFLKNK